MDSKLRLAVPKPLRDGFSVAESVTFYLAPGNEGCLSLYSETGFEKLALKLAGISTGTAEVRNFLRLFYAQAERVEPDNQSRIRLPERLVRFAGLSHDVVMIGVQDHVELWDKARWESFLLQSAAQFDNLTERALEASVPGLPGNSAG